MMTPASPTLRGYCFLAEIISHALSPYYVFGLRLREVELLLAEQRIGVSHESIRQGCLKFGSYIAQKFRRRRSKGSIWHLDEVCSADQRRAALPLASDRPEWRRYRHSREVAPERDCS